MPTASRPDTGCATAPNPSRPERVEAARPPYDHSVGDYDRLGALDASFLHLERLETPMHVGAVSVFEGASFFDATGRFRLAAARALVDSRLHLIPRFRRRLMDVPLGQGRPIWVDDDQFDISYHVRLSALPAPGSRDQLMTLCSRIQARPPRPDPSAVGAVVRRRPRRRSRRVDPEDPPRARRRCVRCRRRHGAPRLHGRADAGRHAVVGARPFADFGRPPLRLTPRTRNAAGRDGPHRACGRSGSATGRRERGTDRAFDAVAGRPPGGRAAHFAQRSGRPKPALRDREGLPRLCEGSPARSRRNRERCRARGCGGRVADPAGVTRRIRRRV